MDISDASRGEPHGIQKMSSAASSRDLPHGLSHPAIGERLLHCQNLRLCVFHFGYCLDKPLCGRAAIRRKRQDVFY